MQLKDFFNFKDLVRTALLGSALFFFVGSMYAVFLHAQFSGEVDQTKQDLLLLKDVLDSRATKYYSQHKGVEAREFKSAAAEADVLAAKIQAPSITPSAYTYMNYWISSAAFTRLHLSPKQLGLPDETVDAMETLTNGFVLGQKGWWNRQEFRGFDVTVGDMRQYLGSPPELQSYFWTFYIFVFVISVFTVFVGVKEQYELPLLPEIIYGAFMPLLFFSIFSLTGLASLTGVVQFLDPSQVSLMVSLIVFVIMSVLSAFGALVAALVRIRFKKVEV
ncbi:MAG: hypothetical protein JW834_03160 [Candidatus Diapherotrites archaeon]|nr:hypothetical protein [Candidatus Diapherotrites archaeon]